MATSIGFQLGGLRQQQQALAQLQFDQEQFQIQRAFQRPQLERQFFQGRQNLPGSFVGRGLLNSGLYKQALERFAESEAFGLGGFDISTAQGLGGFAQRAQGIEAGIADIQTAAAQQRQVQRSQVASQIREIL